jgi:V8-like Glu-specific endopeptidase
MTRAMILALAAGCVVGVFAASPVWAQDPPQGVPDISPPRSIEVAWGQTLPNLGFAGPVEERRVVGSTVVEVPGAAWVRLVMSGTVLGGDPGAEGATIRMTSLADGGVQVLNGESLAWSDGWSVFLNGDRVLVEVLASGSQPSSTLVIDRVIAGEPSMGWGARSICGPTDDRVLSSDPRQGRLSMGCTGWLINDLNGGFLTAGHCGGSGTSVVSFNVPLSTSTGALVASAPQDQYTFEGTSIQFQNGGVGNDWEYFGTVPNSTTGWTAIQVQNARYTLANAPTAAGTSIRITGYGTVAAPVSLTWNQVQKTHLGTSLSLSGTTVRYNTDTTGGNSGSPVINETTGSAIGIHTHGGCSSTGGNNSGTARQMGNLVNALNNPLGVTRSGAGSNTSNLYVIGDLANNLGTCSTSTGNFAKQATVGRRHQGLAYNQFDDNFYMINSLRELYTIAPFTGASTLLGTVSGTTLTFTGLAFDPYTRTLYACTGSNGQIWRINTSTRVATALGGTTANQLSGLDYDGFSRRLLAVADNAGGTVLINVNTSTGAQTILGALGAGITDCNGLSANSAFGTLHTIDATTGNLLQLNPSTGAATVIGSTGGKFGANYGMAARAVVSVCAADFNNDGAVDFFDYLDFVAAFSAGSPAADFNGDTVVDFFDYLDFVASFSSGC